MLAASVTIKFNFLLSTAPNMSSKNENGDLATWTIFLALGSVIFSMCKYVRPRYKNWGKVLNVQVVPVDIGQLLLHVRLHWAALREIRINVSHYYELHVCGFLMNYHHLLHSIFISLLLLQCPWEKVWIRNNLSVSSIS